MSKPTIDKLPELKPQVVEIRRKGFRELYLLDDTWGAGVFLLIGPDKDQFNAWAMERFNCQDPDSGKHEYAYACVIKYEGSFYDIVILRDKKWTWGRLQWGTLVHELHHVTTSILHRKGLTHSKETEECWAYLQDSLLNRFIWALRNRSKVLEEPKKRPLARKRPRK